MIRAVREAGYRELLQLALPIIGVNVGLMAMGAVDTLMVGRLSPEALAGVALGNVYYNVVVMLGVGTLLALDPLLSQALGAGRHNTAAVAVQRAIIVAAVIAVPLGLMLLLAEPVLALMHQPEEVVPLAGSYVRRLIPGLLPYLLFGVSRQTMQSLHRVGPVLIVILTANVVNAALNPLLIFGWGPVPGMGVEGAAWGTTFSRWLMVTMVFLLARRELLPMIRPWRRASWHALGMLRFFGTGLPIAVQIELELAAFAIVALLMGTFGTIPVAGHQIALNLASLTFMVPMGVGMAASVLAGRARGAGDVSALGASARAALVVGTAFMTGTALLFLLLPGFFAMLYTNDARVQAVAIALLPIAGIFQVFDGVQAVSAGILRGLRDTRAPMLISVFGFGGIGISSSWLLAYRTSLGPVGLWWGLVIGLAVVAVVLLLRVRAMLRRVTIEMRSLRYSATGRR